MRPSETGSNHDQPDFIFDSISVHCRYGSLSYLILAYVKQGAAMPTSLVLSTRTDESRVSKKGSSSEIPGIMAYATADGLRSRARVDPYADPTSLEYRLRQKRYQGVKDLIDQILVRHGRCRIIDLGGAELYWDIASGHIDDPRITVDLINLTKLPTTKANFKSLAGDACDLGNLNDMTYDLVHSNSLIEHVGMWNNMVKMAANVRRLAPAYFVQSPYFWFPIEPHFRFPIWHWLPESWRYRLIMRRDIGYMKKAPSVSDAMSSVQSAILLDRKQYVTLFPDAQIRGEKFCGFTKSLIAVRA
jgi:hypothetical protein